ncbi:MAG: PAS domain S-box protein [Deltaproteobacteria bacterium]|nr:PAS domain S-box protein [Deltaproteobacteria bacterium]
MNLLFEDHLVNITMRQIEPDEKISCWEMFSCDKVLCPAHSQRQKECWLIARTHCSAITDGDFINKFSACLSCSYFRARGGDPNFRNWNQFIARQLDNYNTRTLEQIYQKEESFIEILNRIPDGLFTTDKEWRITYFNPSAEKITGFSAYDAVGMYCKDVFKNPICESDCALKRAVEEGRDIHNREYNITNIEGREIPIICSTSAFRDSSGRISGGLEIFKDISEIKQLQKEVTRRERKYRRIFEGSHDMIYTTNRAGKILDMNPAGVQLMEHENKKELMENLNASQLYLHPKGRERFLEKINRKGYVKDYEADFVTKKGKSLHVLISSRRYENPEAGDIEYEGIIKDITHRKQTEEVIKERNRELSILNSVAVALNNTRDLDHMLKVTLKDVLRVLRLKKGALFLIENKEKCARLQIRSGFPRPRDSRKVIFGDRMLEKHLLKNASPLKSEPTFPSFKVRFESSNGHLVPWVSCFIIIFKGKGVGFFGFDLEPDREFNPHELHLIGSIGNFLGGSIENAQLMKMIRLHRQDLRRLTEKLFQSQEEERRRIARELHDEAGQSLTAVKLGLDHLETFHAAENKALGNEISEIRKMITQTASEIRQLSYRLHPTLLIDLGLEPALKLYFREIENRSDLDIDFNMVGFDHRLNVDIETVFYRFSQEALTNTLKHSGAETFRLSIIKSYPKIIFLAKDDGAGFEPQIAGRDRRSLGLLGMRERTSLLGGTFHLRSKPGQGTRIRIEIPLREDDGHV